MSNSGKSPNIASDFEPIPLFKNGSLQTMLANLVSHPKIPKSKTHKVQLSDGDQINLFVDAPQGPDFHDVRILLMHGLGGSCESKYILRISSKLTELGYEVIRFNHRGCGPGGLPLALSLIHISEPTRPY